MEIIPHARREIVFEDIQLGKRLINSTFETRRTLSKTACAKICLVNSKCLSFNFCGGIICELNYRGIYSRSLGDSKSLEDEADCSYNGMKGEEIPQCEERGAGRDIQDDALPNKCKIDGKRIDARWNDWHHEVVVSASTEWKKIDTRECLPAFHGGHSACEGQTEKVLEWFKWEEGSKVWSEAITVCANMGGELS